MLNPLLISRKENAGILRRICSELNAVPREMIGEDWSLAVFLKRDLKTYLYQLFLTCPHSRNRAMNS